MTNQALFSELLGDIYEASYQPDRWPLVIEKICRITHSRSGGLFIQDLSLKEANAHYQYGMSEQMLIDYTTHRHHDPAFAIMQKRAVGEAVNIQSTEQHTLESRDYYEGLRLKNDLGYLAGANVIDNDMHIVGLGLHRSFSASGYDEDTLQLVAELIPHLQRALHIHREFIRLRMEKSALAAGFEHLTMGLVLLDHLGAPVYINPVAQEILANHPSISLNNETLTPVRQEDAAQLRRMVLDCLDSSRSGNRHEGSVMGLHHPSRRHPLAVMAKPVATSDLANMVDGIPVYVALYLTEPSRRLAISAETLGTLYDLTRTESQIAIALANGLGVEEIAQRHNRSINTVRTQLRAIFQKTKTGSQAELIRILLTGTMT